MPHQLNHISYACRKPNVLNLAKGDNNAQTLNNEFSAARLLRVLLRAYQAAAANGSSCSLPRVV